MKVPLDQQLEALRFLDKHMRDVLPSLAGRGLLDVERMTLVMDGLRGAQRTLEWLQKALKSGAIAVRSTQQ